MGTREKECAVLIFAKIPELDFVKTRLQSDLLSNQEVLELYKAFLLDTYYQSSRTKADQVLFSLTDSRLSPRESLDLDFFVSNSILDSHEELDAFHVQPSGDFGKRMEDAIRWAFDRGFRKLIILGADSPQIQPELINSVFVKLNDYDTVLGPSPEGGIYLIGIRRGFDLDGFDLIFEGVELSNYAKYAEEKQLDIVILPELTDIDTETDLISLIAWLDAAEISIEPQYLPQFTKQVLEKLKISIDASHQNNRRKRIIRLPEDNSQ